MLQEVSSCSSWTPELVEKYCYLDFHAQRAGQQQILDYLQSQMPLPRFLAQRSKWQKAKENLAAGQKLLAEATISYPKVLPPPAHFDLGAFNNTAIMLTAGGEGDRLRQSLLAAGYAADKLQDFTKATWSIDGKTAAASPLGYNLLLCRAIGRALGQKLPVIVTLGPAGSGTAKIIPQYLSTFDDEYLDIMTVCQGERLHLSVDGRLVLLGQPDLHAVTNPDETGGAFMAARTLFDQLSARGVDKIVAIQGTTICHPLLVSALAAAIGEYDVAAVGVERRYFEEKDPFGSFVSYINGDKTGTIIVESHSRTPEMYRLKDAVFGHLPYNPGMYAFKLPVLRNADLPDFICPPKTICPGLEPAGKVGYAAIDLLSLGGRVAICQTQAGSFAALKGIDDLPALKEQATKLLDFLPYID